MNCSAALGAPLAAGGEAGEAVIDLLATQAVRGTAACSSPRYFGFVIGGAYPVALAADWLVSTWDQNAGIYVISPLVAVVEEVAAGWLLELFDLPRESGVGFVTGCQMANFTCLAAARHGVLRRAGWDVEADGLYGAPRVNIVASAEAHITIDVALRYLGFGTNAIRRVEADEQGRMRADRLRRAHGLARGPDDRLRAGGQREHRCVRSAARDRRDRAARTRPGCTSMARSVCGRVPAVATRRWPTASSWPIPGPPTRTSGSTCPTTAAWPSSAMPKTTARR